MKSTGIVRKIDELGRVVLPVELRRTLDLHEKDQMEIYVENDKIVLKKHARKLKCQATGVVSDDNLVLANGNVILSKEAAKQLLKEIESNFV
ncbi:AbrB/MazE/SpoVT family DNA-binding domain-containing protein [Oceanobacillus bengalensis]|uniref:AbrB/MazE/SpoVT family DNA-binding domain-containing protein n=1 Tax=Oceanobacillus bengalensis TaxID=1435466 RepID=A0A494YUQ4_9BACI|nr:AbrB/MazE/SpoVT family DNA-binding domain-containing protein [Oceanobacillus bengalensis]RKQ13740.1 AbrB/MazE/SpoVT family DNA-binding domain-containing protein [Oceanobacillus bengalensis]